METQTIDVANSDTSPVIGSLDSTSGTASSAGQESGSGASAQTADGVTVAQSTQDDSGNATQAGSAAPAQEIDPLEGVPSLEELSQNQSQPYAKALVQLRTAYEALKPKYGELESLSGFNDLVGQTTPEQLKTKLDIVDGLFSSAKDEKGNIKYGDDGMPVPDASEGVGRLVQSSPDTAYAVFNALLKSEIDGSPLGNQYLAHCFRQLGLNPDNASQYAEWERTGAPVANTSLADLSKIPQQYMEAVKSLPAKIQEDILAIANAEVPDKELLDYYLNEAQGKLNTQRERLQSQQAAEREAQTAIETNTQTAIQGKFETGFNQFLQHLSTWTPTTDEKINSVYRLEVANTVANLLDNQMSFAQRMLYEGIGIQADTEIPNLNKQFQEQTALAERYRSPKFRDDIRAAQAQGMADSAYMRLVAKLNGVASKIIEYKSKQAEGQQAAEVVSGQSGRSYVAGQPAALAGNGGGDWKRAFYDN